MSETVTLRETNATRWLRESSRFPCDKSRARSRAVGQARDRDGDF